MYNSSGHKSSSSLQSTIHGFGKLIYLPKPPPCLYYKFKPSLFHFSQTICYFFCRISLQIFSNTFKFITFFSSKFKLSAPTQFFRTPLFFSSHSCFAYQHVFNIKYCLSPRPEIMPRASCSAQTESTRIEFPLPISRESIPNRENR